MARTITTTVVIAGKDALSPVAASAATKSVKSLQSIQQRTSKIAAGAFDVSRSMAIVGAGITAPLYFAGKQAIEFEDQLASLGKVANMDLGTKGLTDLANQAKEIAPLLATMPADIVASMTALKQSGLAVNELKDVATFVGKAGVAFDTTAKFAGESFGSIRAAMGLTIAETKEAFDVINQLSNNMNATPERLISFFTAGGAGVGAIMKMRSNEIAGYGAALIQAGKSGEEAATIMERFAKNTWKKDPLRNMYVKNQGAKGLLEILQKGAAIKDDTKRNKYFAQFGEYGLEISRLATSMTGPNGLGSALALVANKTSYAGAVQSEFTSKMKATKQQLKSTWAAASVSIIEFGNNALPIISDFLKQINPIIKQSAIWMKQNPELSSGLFKAAAGAAAFSFAVSGLAAVVGSAAKVVGWLNSGLMFFGVSGGISGAISGMNAAAVAGWAMAAPMLAGAGPYLAVAAAIGAVGYAGYYMYNNFEAVHSILAKIGTAIESIAHTFWPVYKALWKGDFKGAWSGMKKGVAEGNANYEANMKDWRKANPDKVNQGMKPEELAGIEARYQDKKVKGQWLKDVEFNRQMKKNAEMRKLLNPTNIPGKPYYEPDQSKLQPRKINTPKYETKINPAIPQFLYDIAPLTKLFEPGSVEPKTLSGAKGQTGSTIEIKNQPVFNFNGPIDEKTKQDFIGAQRKNADDLGTMLEKQQREKNRKSYEDVLK